jgi:hypothetical protein
VNIQICVSIHTSNELVSSKIEEMMICMTSEFIRGKKVTLPDGSNLEANRNTSRCSRSISELYSGISYTARSLIKGSDEIVAK